MLKESGGIARSLHSEEIDADLVVVGGGMAGVCAAITAAREGIRVCLVQDRPVLGGNASSEVRLWVLGATSHMGNNNRWAREGGVINELLLESAFRNPEGNPLFFDTILLEKVVAEPNLRLLLNTAVHDVELGDEGRIKSATAFCSQNSTRYALRAPLFCDASGDGIVGFLAGAAFRIGAESKDDFGEAWAPEQSHRDLLGHSLYFYTRDTGHPVRFVTPSYALDDITKIPRYRQFSTKDQGCQLWWIEYGGSRDTVHDTEEIKWELWKIVYGVWDHIKNSGDYPDAETLTLDWVGSLPGKRESRRFEGDYVLTQQDIVEQRTHYDAVSFGGWAIDLHPVDAIYNPEDPCTQWHSKGVYQIPYRCLYSRNVPNLFLAGRIISASHIAFGSTRVMATSAHNGQAVGVAAAVCSESGLDPNGLSAADKVQQLQGRLQRTGQYIPAVKATDPHDLAQEATVSASSELTWRGFSPNAAAEPLEETVACLLPVEPGAAPELTVWAECRENTDLTAELRVCSRPGSHTLDTVVERLVVPVTQAPHPVANPPHLDVGRAGYRSSDTAGAVALAAKTKARAQSVASPRPQEVKLAFREPIANADHMAVCLVENKALSLAMSNDLLSGVTTVWRQHNSKVAKSSHQNPPEGIGIDAFAFWTPRRRPLAKNLAFESAGPLGNFGAENVTNGVARPYRGANAWVADPSDRKPTLTLSWNEPKPLRQVELSFDVDYDHALEQVLMKNPESVMPFCVKNFRLRDANGNLLHEETENHQARCVVTLPSPVQTDRLVVEIEAPSDRVPASLFEVRCYA